MASTSDDPPHQYAETSCFGTLSLTNTLRRACIVVNDSWQFDRFILAFIASNAVVLCLMQPTKLEGRGCASTGSNASTSGAGNAAMEDSELVFTTGFTLEMLVKIIAMGFYFEKGSYLSDGWNVMDFLVVVVSLVSLTVLLTWWLRTIIRVRRSRRAATVSSTPSADDGNPAVSVNEEFTS